MIGHNLTAPTSSVTERRRAVNLLNSAKTDLATSILRQATKYSDVVVRLQALSALLNRSDISVLDEVESILLHPPARSEEYLLANLSAALEGIKDAQAIPTLKRLLISSIKQALAAGSDEKAKGAVRKFIPTSQHVYGVRLPLLNQIAKEHREGGFELAEALWKSGAFEEKLLAAKLLGSSCKKNPDRALTLAKKFAAQISDWAVCDTLGMQGVKGIALKKQIELFAWSKQASQIKEPVGAPPRPRFAYPLREG